MKNMQMEGHTQAGGCYTKDGNEVTDFILGVKKIIFQQEGVCKYKFLVKTKQGKSFEKIAPLKEVKQHCFLQELPLFMAERDEFCKQLYQTLSKKVFTEAEIEYQTGRNGLQEVEGKFMYVFTNGAIAADGFHSEIYSGVGKMFIPESSISEEVAEMAEKLFREYNRNCNIFYPLFLYNIMGISNGFFRTIDEPEFMKLTLWIDGKSGSGKTELAKAAGAYTFGDQMLNKELIAATGKRRDALRHLAQSSGSVCILDDVKVERVRERKNSIRNTVDDLIRSTFRGRLTETVGMNSEPEWIDACVLITGEYLDTCESQNARLMYMQVDGFVDDERNSRTLRVLSKNPMWLTTVCAGYIQWFLNMIEECSFPKFVQEKLGEARNGEKMYQGINNSARLNENRHMLEMAAVLSKMFFQKIGMPQEFVERFVNNSRRSITAIAESTFCLLGGEQMLILQALERIFAKCAIRIARYQKEPSRFSEWKYQQKYFWIRKDEDFVWIEDYKKSILKSCQNENEQYDEKPCLIVREDRFDELFQEAVQDLTDKIQISSEVFDKLHVNPLKKLREMQIIYKQYRADSKWGRPAVSYPTCKLETVSNFRYPDDAIGWPEYDDASTEETICYLDCEPVIQMNTEHPCINILRKRMDGIKAEDTYESLRNWQVRGITKEEAYCTRKAFINSKALYKE